VDEVHGASPAAAGQQRKGGTGLVRGPNPAALQITLLTISTGTPQSGRTKPAYNQSLANGWLTITASALNDYGSVLPTVTQNSLHPLSPSSISAHHLLDFMAQAGLYGTGKDNRGRRTVNPSGRHPIWIISAPNIILPFLH